MNISGTNSIKITEGTSAQPIELRVNQRISAEILNVSGDQVTLVVQGNTVVGKISAGEQSLLLADRRNATFIVKGMVDGVLQLQLVRGEGKEGVEGGISQWTALAQNLLKLNGLAVNEENLMIGRSLLGAGLPITGDLVSKLQKILNGFSGWGQIESDVAAALLSNGLPLSTGTLGLALQQAPSLIESFRKLQEKLTNLLNNNKLSSELNALTEKTLMLIQEGRIDISANTSDLMKQLSMAVSVWGKSLESQLAEIVKEDEALDDVGSATGWLSLAYLRRGLVENGNTDVVKEIDRFLDSLRQMQFLNTSQTKDPNNPPWLTLNMPLSSGAFSKEQQMEMEKRQAHLKISYRGDEDGNVIDPNNNRIVLTVELENGEYLEADLSMVEKKIGAWLTVPNDEWRGLVESEIPSLQSGLENLGYRVQFARCDIKQDESTLANDMGRLPERIDLEA